MTDEQPPEIPLPDHEEQIAPAEEASIYASLSRRAAAVETNVFA